ncbi:MAG: 5-formyltetrahydrofolate cyclo-ligase [Glaciecola sp.]
MTTKAQTRQGIRQAFRDKRLALSTEQQTSAACALVQQYKQSPLFEHATKVALYLSFNGEINTRALIDYLWSKQASVYVPVIHPFSKGHLLFQQYTASTPMICNRFGIFEPKLDSRFICPISALDILFTPLVAFDLKGNRLGMGGGFYDRTLASLGRTEVHAKPTLIGLAHDIQQTAELPIEHWDIPLPHILTSSKLHSFR